MTSDDSVASLRSQIRVLESRLASMLLPRSATLDLSAIPDEENPYSRLVALEKMKIVPEFAAIRRKKVAVVGIGGIGSIACEMLTRCGVGQLVLFDYDTVSVVNMNRMFFLPTQIGLAKVDAAAETLRKINPDVAVTTSLLNVSAVATYDDFLRLLVDTDLLLCCVDNFEARVAVNRVCLQLDLPWIESGVSETAVSGHIQFVKPGATACYECAPPLVVVTEKIGAPRDGVCAASLPTTMGVIAGLLVQNALKYLLRFGEVCPVVGYNALMDFFPKYAIKANAECRNPLCVAKQKEVAAQRAKEETRPCADEESEADEIVHASNEWGIEIVSNESAAAEALGDARVVEHPSPALAKGDEPSVDDLMDQFSSLMQDE